MIRFSPLDKNKKQKILSIKITIHVSICSNNCIKSHKNWENPERISKIKPFMDKHNWEGINHPSEKKMTGNNFRKNI